MNKDLVLFCIREDIQKVTAIMQKYPENSEESYYYAGMIDGMLDAFKTVLEQGRTHEQVCCLFEKP